MKQRLKFKVMTLMLIPALVMASTPMKPMNRLTFYFTRPVTVTLPWYIYPQVLINNQVQPEDLDDIPGHFTIVNFPDKINSIKLRYGITDPNTGKNLYMYTTCPTTQGKASFAINPDYNTITGKMSCTKVYTD